MVLMKFFYSFGGYEKEPLEFFMIIYDPQDHGTLCRNSHEPGFTPEP